MSEQIFVTKNRFRQNNLSLYQFFTAGKSDVPYHKMLLNGQLPYTIGGGIGQSRLCMLLLNRAHVGEVQASLWPEEMRRVCGEHQIFLL